MLRSSESRCREDVTYRSEDELRVETGVVAATMPGMTTITEAVTSWPGVTAGPGERGEFSFKVGRKEIGHLHGDRVAHFGFPKNVWHELYDAGRIHYHPLPASRASARGRSQ